MCESRQACKCYHLILCIKNIFKPQFIIYITKRIVYIRHFLKVIFTSVAHFHLTLKHSHNLIKVQHIIYYTIKTKTCTFSYLPFHWSERKHVVAIPSPVFVFHLGFPLYLLPQSSCLSPHSPAWRRSVELSSHSILLMTNPPVTPGCGLLSSTGELRWLPRSL